MDAPGRGGGLTRPQDRTARQRQCGPDAGWPQYVARPPEMSNTAPVLNAQSSLHSQAIIAAASGIPLLTGLMGGAEPTEDDKGEAVFPDALPHIYNAIEVTFSGQTGEGRVVLHHSYQRRRCYSSRLDGLCYGSRGCLHWLHGYGPVLPPHFGSRFAKELCRRQRVIRHRRTRSNEPLNLQYHFA